jgi:hypothetical protein
VSDDVGAIKAAVQIYFDGLHEGDAEKLAFVFHFTSALTWEENGVLTPLPRAEAESGAWSTFSEKVAGSRVMTRSCRSIKPPLPCVREAQVRYRSALLHGLFLPSEDRKKVANRSERLRYGNSWVIPLSIAVEFPFLPPTHLPAALS